MVDEISGKTISVAVDVWGGVAGWLMPLRGRRAISSRRALRGVGGVHG